MENEWIRRRKILTNMIENIRIRNFKCIKELDLDLAPLTILIGENGSGKSSILEAIAVMNQSLNQEIDVGLKKGVIEFEKPENAYHKGEEKPSLDFEAKLSKEKAERISNEFSEDLKTSDSKSEKEKMIEKVYFISSFRGSFPWKYKAEGMEDYVGKSGENTIEVINSILKSRNMEKIRDLEFFSGLFGVKAVWAGYFGRGDILTSACLDQHFGSPYTLSFPNMGSGSKQILPVISQIIKSDSGSILLIEEPEISMHPAYQILLLALFEYAIEAGEQLIITTHSSYLPLSIKDFVSGKEIKAETSEGLESKEIKLDLGDIALYHIQRGEDECTKAEKIYLDESGHLRDPIPSFIEVERELFKGLPLD